MSEEMIARILDLITSVGGALATDGFGVLVRQAVNQGIVNTIIGVILLFFVVVSVVVFFQKFRRYRVLEVLYHATDNYQEQKKYMREQEVCVTWCFVTGTISLIAFSVLAATLPSGVLQLLNPEYYAIKMLLTAIN